MWTSSVASQSLGLNHLCCCSVTSLGIFILSTNPRSTVYRIVNCMKTSEPDCCQHNQQLTMWIHHTTATNCCIQYINHDRLNMIFRRLKPAIGRRLRLCVIAATGRRKHTQVDLSWITRHIRRISAFPINLERLDASVYTSMLPEIGCKGRTCATRATDVIYERKHCSRRRRHTQVEITSANKQLGNSKTITRNCWYDARIY